MNAGAIVIVGAGQAGGWAATTLRDRGYDGRIVLLGDEPHAPYERPPLSKAVLSGQALAESTELFAARKLESMGIEFEPGVAALRLRLADKRVDTSDGRALAYDKLISAPAAGSRCRRCRAWTMTACVRTGRRRAAARRLGPDRHVLIVGGGWIGWRSPPRRASPAARSRCWSARRGCARAAQPGVSAHLATLHAANGVALRLNAGLRAVGGSADGRPVAELADGSSIVADAIVLGVGLTPNDAGARRRHCLRSRRAGGRALPHIGAGRVRGRRCGRVRAAGGGRLRLESWQNAQDQGTAAALSALGLGEAYRPTGAVWSEQYDAMVQIVGFPALAASEVLRPQRMPARCCRWRWMRKAAPWRA